MEMTYRHDSGNAVHMRASIEQGASIDPPPGKSLEEPQSLDTQLPSGELGEASLVEAEWMAQHSEAERKTRLMTAHPPDEALNAELSPRLLEFVRKVPSPASWLRLSA